jgi:hypothetical protein
MVIRLAKTGPKIQINVAPEESPIKRQLRELQKAFAESQQAAIKEKNDPNKDKDTVVND